MKTINYEPYKYCIQDVSKIFIGSKFSLGEMIDNPEIPFKVKAFVEKYLLNTFSKEDTLESVLYFIEPANFAVTALNEAKAKVKVNVISEKKSIFGKVQKKYVTKVMPIYEMAVLSKEDKESVGLVIQELILSKLSLLSL